MPKICYIEKKFNNEHSDIIKNANEIINEYELQGFDLTLRQLYYQFVARDLISNNIKEYNRLGLLV